VTEEAFNSYESLHKYFYGGEVLNYRRTLIFRLKNNNLRRFYFPKTFVDRYDLKLYGNCTFEIWGHFNSNLQFILRRKKKTGIAAVVLVVGGNPHDLDKRRIK